MLYDSEGFFKWHEYTTDFRIQTSFWKILSSMSLKSLKFFLENQAFIMYSIKKFRFDVFYSALVSSTNSIYLLYVWNKYKVQKIKQYILHPIQYKLKGIVRFIN